MKLLRVSAVALVVGVLGVSAARSGLYNDEQKITTGDIKDLDYWHAKFYHLMLEAALQSHQPEYLVGNLAEGQIENDLPPLIKKYPNHDGLKKWLAQCEDVVNQVDKNADRTLQWKPDFAYWTNESYRQAWVNMNLGKMDVDVQDWNDAAERYGWADHNLDILIDHEDDFMKNWPADIVKWVHDTKPEAAKMAKETKAKT